MKQKLLIILLIFSLSNCNAQTKKPIKQLFINKFIIDNIKNSSFLYRDTLYIYSKGNDYKFNNININFLDFDEVKKRAIIKGNFNIIEASEIYIKKNTVMMEFNFLIALKDKGVDFAALDNTTLIYCMMINKNNKIYINDCSNALTSSFKNRKVKTQKNN